jgi:peptide/nickel transport system substrate-binding protein
MENAGIAGSIISQLWYPSRPRPFLPNPRAVAEAIAADLQAIGIKVVLNTADWTTYQRRALDGGYPLYLQGWTGDSPDADGFLSGLFTGDTVARSIGYTNPDLTAALAGGRSQSDAVTRLSIYRQAAAIVRRDMARVPLVYPQSAVLLSNRVTGFAPSLLGVESLRTTSLSK